MKKYQLKKNFISNDGVKQTRNIPKAFSKEEAIEYITKEMDRLKHHKGSIFYFSIEDIQEDKPIQKEGLNDKLEAEIELNGKIYDIMKAYSGCEGCDLRRTETCNDVNCTDFDEGDGFYSIIYKERGRAND